MDFSAAAYFDDIDRKTREEEIQCPPPKLPIHKRILRVLLG